MKYDVEFGQPSDLKVVALYASRANSDAVPARTAPREFRIWRAGDNRTDHGEAYFTPRSAELLMAEQAQRGNLYSIDVDHSSLRDTAPIDVRKAVGWHKLEVRPDEAGEPELWAVDVEWTEAVRGGLEKDPPEWRFISPAFDVDTNTREVIRYLNTALTNNPATWNAEPITATRIAASQNWNLNMNQPTSRGLPPRERAELRRRMGLTDQAEDFVTHAICASTFRALPARDAQRILAGSTPQTMRANITRKLATAR